MTQLLDHPTYHDITEAKHKIPAKYQGLFTFFSAYDHWNYAVNPTLSAKGYTVCNQCLQHEDITYAGHRLRTFFPHLEILNQGEIHPHIHPNCRCRLYWATGWTSVTPATPSDQ